MHISEGLAERASWTPLRQKAQAGLDRANKSNTVKCTALEHQCLSRGTIECANRPLRAPPSPWRLAQKCLSLLTNEEKLSLYSKQNKNKPVSAEEGNPLTFFSPSGPQNSLGAPRCSCFPFNSAHQHLLNPRWPRARHLETWGRRGCKKNVSGAGGWGTTTAS